VRVGVRRNLWLSHICEGEVVRERKKGGMRVEEE
jgi:hypothetical protein